MRDRGEHQDAGSLGASGSSQLPRESRGEGARVEEWLRFVQCFRRVLDQLAP
ncbi:MAG: hypothetical protein WKG01_37115 [Kofleriaceae bacterium]